MHGGLGLSLVVIGDCGGCGGGDRPGAGGQRYPVGGGSEDKNKQSQLEESSERGREW